MITKSLNNNYTTKSTYNYLNKIIIKPTCALTKIALSGITAASTKAFTIGITYLGSKSLSYTVDYFNKAKEDFIPCAAANAAKDVVLKGPNALIKEYWSEKSTIDLLSPSYWISLYKDLTNIPGKSTQDPEFLQLAKYICGLSEKDREPLLVNTFSEFSQNKDPAFGVCKNQTPKACANEFLPQYLKECHLFSAPDTSTSSILDTVKRFFDTNILKPAATSTCSAYSADINYMLLSASVFAAITAGFGIKAALQTTYNMYTKHKKSQDLESRLLALETLMKAPQKVLSIPPADSTTPIKKEHLSLSQTLDKDVNLQPSSPEETLMKAPKEVLNIPPEDSTTPITKDHLSLSQTLDKDASLQPPSLKLIKLFHNIGLTNFINRGI